MEPKQLGNNLKPKQFKIWDLVLSEKQWLANITQLVLYLSDIWFIIDPKIANTFSSTFVVFPICTNISYFVTSFIHFKAYNYVDNIVTKAEIFLLH